MTAKLAPIFLRYRFGLLVLLSAAAIAGFVRHSPTVWLAAALFVQKTSLVVAAEVCGAEKYLLNAAPVFDRRPPLLGV